jgi:predicted nucleic acid-binding protein
MSRIFWDTNLFIYLFEKNAEHFAGTVKLRHKMLERRDELFTSTMTLGEVQSKPIQQLRPDLAAAYRKAIRATAQVISFNDAAADRYAQIRADYVTRPPDAIQLACAAIAGVDLFITNDAKLTRLNIPGIGFIVTPDRVPI